MNKRNKTKNLYFSEQIIKVMNEVLDYPLTIVEAPMGYGKTTAVKEQLNKCDALILWQKVFDISVDFFWSGFVSLFAGVDDVLAQSLEQLGFPEDSLSLHKAISIFEDASLPERTVIVIDDYHLINSEEVNRFIEQLIMNEVDNLYIVLTARYFDLPNKEELSVKGYLHYIKKESFELKQMDIKEYFRLCGINLNNNEVEELFAYTEGWISALYLIMLNYRKEGRFDTISDIYGLVEKAVYIPFSEEIKELLIMLCTFDGFTIEQASYVWKKENAAKLLTEIMNENALIKYDIKSKTYQIHNIFLEFLREKLENKGTDYKKQVYLSVAEWHVKAGNYLAAMHNFYLIHEYGRLLDVLELDKGHSIHNKQKEAFIKFYDACPEQVKIQHPIALLIYGICAFSFNEVKLFQKVCEEFSSAIQMIEEFTTDQNLGDKENGTEVESRVSADVRIGVEEGVGTRVGVEAGIDTKMGVKTTVAVAVKAYFDTEAISSLRGEFELLLSFTEYNNINKMLEHIKNAHALLKHPAKFMDTQGSWTFGSPSVLYMYHREAGDLEIETQFLKEAIPLYCNLTNGHGKGSEFVMEAELHFNRGDMENAEILSHKALYLANCMGQSDIMLCAMFLQARIAFYKGDYSYVLYTFQKLQEDMKLKKQYNLMHTIDLCEAYVNACLGRSEKIPQWVSAGDFDSSRLYFPTMAYMNIVYGRALLINGEYLKLLGIAEQLIGIASVFPNLMGGIYTYIYIAAANEKKLRREEALDALKIALDFALPDRLYMPFVENCDYIKDLLEEFNRLGYFAEDITEILKLYKQYHNSVKQTLTEHFYDCKPTLTKREMEIAQLAANGMTNKEIGASLFISTNTVKMALKGVFSKLSINNRALLEKSLIE